MLMMQRSSAFHSRSWPRLSELRQVSYGSNLRSHHQIRHLLRLSNLYIDERAPWSLRRTDPEEAAEVIRNAVIKAIDELDKLSPEQLLENRQKRLAGFGAFKEA